MDLVLKLNVFVTSTMFGVIWLVQLVHYPMFAGLDSETFSDWHRFHSNRITYIVAPMMIAELAVSLVLAWMRWDATSIALFALTVGVWGATFFVSVPLHASLENRKQPELISRLVATNWIRTVLYSLKITLLFCLLTVSW